MTYTEEAKQALSRKVAKKHNLQPYLRRIDVGTPIYSESEVWLHDDWHTLGEECAKRRMSVDYYVNHVHVVSLEGELLSKVAYKDCQSESEAERIARLMALGEL